MFLSLVLVILGASGLVYGNPLETKPSTNYGRIPLVFEENRGQTDSRVKFLAHSSEYSIFITGSQAFFSLRAGGKSAAVAMQVVGARSDAEPMAESPLSSHTNYFLGNDRSKWIRGARHFGKVRVAGIKKGVDVVYYGNPTELEYDLILSAGADSSDLRLSFEGAQSLGIDHNGDLLIHTAAGDLRQHAPTAWQESAGVRRPVEISQLLQDKNSVVLKVGDYDRNLPLVIDPVVSYSTYLGGSSGDSATAIAVDSSGNAYVTGTTASLDFPVTSGAYHGGAMDAYIAKLNPGGTALIYSTYIGGSNADIANAIALDNSGNAFITGWTLSSDFPVVFAGSSIYAPSQNAFVTMVNSSGVIQASRYLGGAGSVVALQDSGGIRAVSPCDRNCGVCNGSRYYRQSDNDQAEQFRHNAA